MSDCCGGGDNDQAARWRVPSLPGPVTSTISLSRARIKGQGSHGGEGETFLKSLEVWGSHGDQSCATDAGSVRQNGVCPPAACPGGVPPSRLPDSVTLISEDGKLWVKLVQSMQQGQQQSEGIASRQGRGGGAQRKHVQKFMPPLRGAVQERRGQRFLDGIVKHSRASAASVKAGGGAV